MKSIITTALLFTLTAGYSLAQSLSPIGTFVYKYADGPTYRVTIPNTESLTWECIEGAEKGAKGEEHPSRFTVDDGIFFATWIEKTGIIVTQVVNLKTNKVYTTIVEGKERYVLVGDISKDQ
ncbi:MAG: MoaF C-terminal domain-containing protein [Luteolibacter sp.]